MPSESGAQKHPIAPPAEGRSDVFQLQYRKAVFRNDFQILNYEAFNHTVDAFIHKMLPALRENL